MTSARFVLASGSAVRRRLLEAAGVAFEVLPAGIDETAIIESARAEDMAPRDLADLLAEMKALQVSRKKPEALVLGADQLLVCGDEVFEKPKDADEARSHLIRLRGRAHDLVGGAVLARGGEAIWRHVSVCRLTMRDFSNTFLDLYLARTLPDILNSVGAYHLEGEGAQLFSKIEGDYFSILGLPLLPLLDTLRTQKAISR